MAHQSSFRESFSLLHDRHIFLLFVGIMMHVGIDVGINTTTPKLLMGVFSDTMQSQTDAVVVLSACIIYLIILSSIIKDHKQ